MYQFLFKYYKYFLLFLIFYCVSFLFKSIINIYTFILFIFILSIIYYRNKKLFKRIIYKVYYKNKNNFSFNNKYTAAKLSLKEINNINNKIINKVNSQLIDYEKNKLEQQLKYGDYNVILFGAGSSGKTSIARALLKSIVGKVSPTIGTTKSISSYKIRIPILKRNINIIDTPGLFEASLQGEEREKATIIEASKSDLILFVLDQDINKYELYLVKKLLKLNKEIIIVLNKCDLRSEKENDYIKKNIISITSDTNYKITVVKTIASFNSLPSRSLDYINVKPDVDKLFKNIIVKLDDNGEELLADNILFRCNKLGIVSKKIINDQRNSIANRVINKYTWITGGVILVNPLPTLDLLATTSVNVKMIIEISKIYDIKLTKKEALDLSKSLITTLVRLGIFKGGLSLITSALSSNFTTLFISKTVQSITTCWLIKIVGLTINEYFKNGQKWSNGGIQEDVNKIYQLNKREEFLEDFIKEAINKIKLKNNDNFKKKLPPNI